MTYEELLKDEAFLAAVEAAIAAKDIPAVQAALREKGIEIPAEELHKALEPTDQELSEDDLDNVAGGISWKSVKSGVKAVLDILKRNSKYLVI